MTADNAREGVACQHSALASSASGNHIVCCAGIQKNCCQNTNLNIGQLCLIICGIHTIVVYLMSHRFYNFLQRTLNNSVLSCLAVLINQCNFHVKNPLSDDSMHRSPINQ